MRKADITIMKRRGVSFLLSVAIVCSSIFAGCASEDTTKTKETSEASSKEDENVSEDKDEDNSSDSTKADSSSDASMFNIVLLLRILEKKMPMWGTFHAMQMGKNVKMPM